MISSSGPKPSSSMKSPSLESLASPLALKGVRIFGVGRNLWTVTQYKGADPEIDSNLQLGKYPNTRQFAVGAELTF